MVNKCDLLDPVRLQQLEDALKARFPNRSVVRISAREGWGVEQWLDLILAGDLGDCPTMDVDYDTYAEGEAMLGWLNATAVLSVPVPADGNAADGNAFVRQLGEAIRAALEAESVEIAHLKMTLEPDGIGNDLAVANLVRNGSPLELPHALQEPLQSGTLIINLHTEADPNILREVVLRLLSTPGGLFTIGLKNIEAFRPGRPVPTHRLARA